jgi:hypothetical protein
MGAAEPVLVSRRRGADLASRELRAIHAVLCNSRTADSLIARSRNATARLRKTSRQRIAGSRRPRNRLAALRASAPANYGFRCFWARAHKRASCVRSSGVSSLPKSSASNTGRISATTPSSKGARFSHSTASSSEFTCQSQKPALISSESSNDPSITFLCEPENLTRLPRGGMKSFAREHNAGLHQLLVELPHLGEDLLAGHLACFRVLIPSHDCGRTRPPFAGIPHCRAGLW